MIKEKDMALDREINKVMEIEHQREERIRSRFRLDKENTDDAPPREERSSARDRSKERRRKSHDKREKHSHAHKEAKKKQHEMQYDDGEEEMEEDEEEEEAPRLELGDHIAGPSGGEGGKESKGGSENMRLEVEIKQEQDQEAKIDKVQESLDDGNNTDVDYEDEDANEEEETTIISSEMLSDIPMPPEPQGPETKGGEVPMETDGEEKEKQGKESEGVTEKLVKLAEAGGEEVLNEEGKERRRQVTVAEDGEGVADEPANE